MGARGPIPKPSKARRRRNKDGETTKVRAPAHVPLPADQVQQLVIGRARDVIERVQGETDGDLLAAATAVESRVTVQRAIHERLEELAAARYPVLPAGTHQIARDWYESLKRSGQAELYQPSDWMAALFVAEAITRLLKAATLSAVGFAAVWSAMGELLTTEGARRRARVEIEKPKPAETPKGVTAMDDYRRRLQG